MRERYEFRVVVREVAVSCICAMRWQFALPSQPKNFDVDCAGLMKDSVARRARSLVVVGVVQTGR